MKHCSDELTEMASKLLINEVVRLQDEIEHLKNKLKTEKRLRWYALRFIQDAGLIRQFKNRNRLLIVDPPNGFMTGPELWIYPNHSLELNN